MAPDPAPQLPVTSDVDLAIRTLWSASRSTWHNWPRLEITQVALCLAVIEGDIAVAAEANDCDMDHVGVVLGGLVMSAIRWMDDLGLSPQTYIHKAISTQRKHVSDV